MGAACLFRKAIARQLADLSACSEVKALSLLGTPAASPTKQFGFPVQKLLEDNDKQRDPIALCQQLASQFKPNDWIQQASATGSWIHFDVSPTTFIKETLVDVYQQKSNYGHHYGHGSNVLVVIDYSSPNIAKPFHAGHLRSTILGNFIKRIHEAMGYRVVGINYLGDWGKQYGLLAVGFEKYGSQIELERDPIHHLYDVYVHINKEKTPEVDQQANYYFKCMEQGDSKALEQWRRFRNLSIASYANVYKRLGITFDRYSGESETEPYIQQVYDRLREHNLIQESPDGAWSVSLEKYGLGTAVVRRADGTSLYMTRDLASLMLRQELYGNKIDKAIYVVGSEQSLYLKQLFKIAELLYGDDAPKHLEHASFGRIEGMSTRKGTVVFLEDILDTAQEKMLGNMRQSNQFKYQELLTEGVLDDENRLLRGQDAVNYVADQLGISAVLVQDMIAKRVKNYEFSYDRMTASRGYTGVYLQFSYARMCGIERKANIPVTPDCDFALLKEPKALELCLMISQFPDKVLSAFQSLEPSTLVHYLFSLSHTIGQANALLRVKGSEPKTAEARMLLMWAAKTTLGNGMRLLGIKPLERM